MSDVYAPQEPMAAGEFDLLRREQVFGSGLANVIPLHRRGQHQPVESVPDFESPIIEPGEPFEDEDGLVGHAWNVAVTGVRLARTAVRSAREALSIEANQRIHGFGDREYWRQMGDPVEIRTSFGTEHQVRRLRPPGVDPKNLKKVLLPPPLGASTDGGYMAEVAWLFYQAGFEAWTASTAGFEGSLPAREAALLSVRRETQYFEEVVDKAVEEYGEEDPTFDVFGASQGGGIGLGLRYRALTKGRPIGKTFAVAPCSGREDHRIRRTLRAGERLLTSEPVALGKHILGHERGPIRRALQLAPTINLGRGALLQTGLGALGLTLRNGHDNLTSGMDEAMMNAVFDPKAVQIVCLRDDKIVAPASYWPARVTREDPGHHMDVIDKRYVEEAIAFFKG